MEGGRMSGFRITCSPSVRSLLSLAFLLALLCETFLESLRLFACFSDAESPVVVLVAPRLPQPSLLPTTSPCTTSTSTSNTLLFLSRSSCCMHAHDLRQV